MNHYLIIGLILFMYMNSWFIVSLIKKRNDIADTAWGLGFVLLSWIMLFLVDNVHWRNLAVNILVTIWGLRLAFHVYRRNQHKSEDYRYLAWRKEWGSLFYLRSYLQVYLLQGFFLFLIVIPVLFINQNTRGALALTDIIGVAVWILGFYFESVGDKQLKTHISNPANKGKLMTTGLWRYTRHPNYFGEVTQWWGLFIIALSLPSSFPTIIGPLTITVLILFVSGIPLLEKKYAGRADWIDYCKRTSIFIPLPPKQGSV